MIGGPGHTRAALFSFFLALLLGLGASLAFGQSASPDEAPAWQPPEVSQLPLEWWQSLNSPSDEILRDRMERLLAEAQKAVGGLDGLQLVSGQNLLQNVRGQLELLVLARQSGSGDEFAPIPTRQEYTLDELLALRAQWRGLDRQQQIPKLRLNELQSQAGLLRQRIDSLLRQYTASNENSPQRILLGLQRMSARLEYEFTLEQSNRLKERQSRVEEQRQLLSQQLEFARKNLVTEEIDWQALDDAVEAAQAELSSREDEEAEVQQQLLEVLSSGEARPSLEILRKQQFTRSSAEHALAAMEELKSRSERAWYRLRAGQLPPGFDIQKAVEEGIALVDESEGEIRVWTTASQTTLLTTAPANDPNSAANTRLAHEAARETLSLLDDIHGAIDDLHLLGEVLTADQVSMQSGLSNLSTRLDITLDEVGFVLGHYLNITLFHIGDAAVTIGSVFKMIIILALGFALSWFIRHLLKRLEGRRQFAKSPAVYTLGRLLHYIIILIAVFAAFGSIGLDFSNFALIAGALSVGIGFGLQSIVNNFVSGLILLFEGSLRVGDYIELENGLRGIVKEVNTRATVVNTNDSIDVVVPNSQFVSNQLTNWTLREPLARFRIDFGVAYGSDKETVRQAALEAAKNVEFVVHHTPGREPQVRLTDFGDSALVFQLLCWVSRSGVRRPERVRSTILWELETQLREHGIEIPFPQRDLHLRSGFTPAETSAEPAFLQEQPSGRDE